MQERAIRRAAVAALLTTLLATSAAFADTLPTDTDDVMADVQTSAELGPIGPGGWISIPVWFELRCNGTVNHIDPGQTVSLAIAGASMPSGGAVAGFGTTVGPVPADWPADGTTCDGWPVLRSDMPASISVRAPGSPGLYRYTIDFERRLSPVGPDDALDIAGVTRLTIWLDVVPNTPPALTLPTDMTVEGDAVGGATVAYAVSAIDAEDDPDPTPVCSPASGSFFGIGTTTVSCTVTDATGAGAAGSFEVTVVDTTPPTLVGMPGPTSQGTGDPTGAAAAYAAPTALDVVDPDPIVSCLPAPGDWLPVGTTDVTCTATDAAGNSASASFPVTVSYELPVVLGAVFEAPVGPSNVVGGAAGRTVPVKVHLTRGGQAVTGGTVDLVLAPCGGGELIGGPIPLAWQGDRWFVGLDTNGLAGCVRGTVRLDGATAGTFDLTFDAQAAKAKGQANAKGRR
jgi:hypothetical protein